MRTNIDTFEIENPKEAMEKFQAALAQVVKVPKSVVDHKRKRAKAKRAKKRKTQPPEIENGTRPTLRVLVSQIC